MRGLVTKISNKYLIGFVNSPSLISVIALRGEVIPTATVAE